jgi:DNA repair ATPase RecN
MGGWSTNRTDQTANHIDHIADKASFAIDMINNALIGFDAIEKELMELSSAAMPPQPEALRAIAHRVDSHQKQVQDGLAKLKNFMSEIDRTTDNIQNQSRTGWKY